MNLRVWVIIALYETSIGKLRRSIFSMGEIIVKKDDWETIYRSHYFSVASNIGVTFLAPCLIKIIGEVPGGPILLVPCDDIFGVVMERKKCPKFVYC